MKDEEKWRCCGCGEPVDGDGFPTCECPTNVLYKRGTNEHALKPRPCATCGARRTARFPKPSAMKDDAERAREIGGRLLQDKVWAEARQRFLNDATQQDFENHLIRVAGEQAALLAFAQQPEGWVLVPREPTPEIIAMILPKVGNPTDADRDVAAKALDVLGAEFEPVGMIVAAELVRDYRAMLAAATMLGAERCA